MQLSTFCSYLWVLSSSFVLGDQSYNWGSPSQWPSHTFGSSIPSAAASQASSQPQSLASTAASAVPSQSQSPASTSPTASQTYSSSAATYTNPIYNQFGADPWVVKNGNYYYMTYTTNDNVTILRSSVLTYVPQPSPAISTNTVVTGTGTMQISNLPSSLPRICLTPMTTGLQNYTTSTPTRSGTSFTLQMLILTHLPRIRICCVTSAVRL